MSNSVEAFAFADGLKMVTDEELAAVVGGNFWNNLGHAIGETFSHPERWLWYA
jgi:hypothetical protein